MDSTDLTTDDIFSILGNSRRRLLLLHLDRLGGEADMQTLARLVAAAEEDVPPEDVSNEQVRRVYISLHQHHVPNLSDFGIVEYHAKNSKVTVTDQLYDMIDQLSVSRRPWALYYLGTLLVGLSVVGFVYFIPGLSTTIVWPILVAVVLLLAVVHWYLEERSTGTADMPDFLE